MNKRKFLVIGGLTILLLWLLSWVLIVILIPKQDTRGQFGDMFGAVNSLFSGLALCGVVYSILLQTESNRSSEYQFKFNHLLDIVNKQTDIFNLRVMEFSFLDSNYNPLDFSSGIKYFKEISKDASKTEAFIDQNKDAIDSLLPFIYHSNKFTHDLIDKENILDPDKQKLKKLYSRNQNRFIIDYYSLNIEILRVERNKFESLTDDLRDISKSIYDIRVSMIMSILNDDYR